MSGRLVQAVGLDWKDSEYALTMQIFDPEAAQGDDTSGGKMLRVTGKTISQAMRNANLKQGQEIFWGHTKLIIIGEQIAKDGIESVMAYFNADAQSRPNIDVLIADGEAGEVLSEPLDSTILPVLSTKMMLEGYQDNGKLVRSQLRGILGSLGKSRPWVHICRWRPFPVMRKTQVFKLSEPPFCGTAELPVPFRRKKRAVSYGRPAKWERRS